MLVCDDSEMKRKPRKF